MEFLEVIENRKSIRAYEKKEVSDELIRKIIECGHKAPTAGNLQPWEFIIVKNNENKRKIVNTTFVGNNFDGSIRQEWLMTAPVFIVVVANKERSEKKYGEKALKTLIYLDCSACIENMLLAAVNFRLASCYISGFREEELAKVLELPAGYEVIGFLPIGYQKGKAVSRPKLEVNTLIYKEKFQKK